MEKQSLTKYHFIDNADLIVSLALDSQHLMDNADSIKQLATLIKFFGQALPDGELAVMEYDEME